MATGTGIMEQSVNLELPGGLLYRVLGVPGLASPSGPLQVAGMSGAMALTASGALPIEAPSLLANLAMSTAPGALSDPLVAAPGPPPGPQEYEGIMKEDPEEQASGEKRKASQPLDMEKKPRLMSSSGGRRGLTREESVKLIKLVGREKLRNGSDTYLDWRSIAAEFPTRTKDTLVRKLQDLKSAYNAIQEYNKEPGNGSFWVLTSQEQNSYWNTIRSHPAKMDQDLFNLMDSYWSGMPSVKPSVSTSADMRAGCGQEADDDGEVDADMQVLDPTPREKTTGRGASVGGWGVGMLTGSGHGGSGAAREGLIMEDLQIQLRAATEGLKSVMGALSGQGRSTERGLLDVARAVNNSGVMIGLALAMRKDGSENFLELVGKARELGYIKDLSGGSEDIEEDGENCS